MSAFMRIALYCPRKSQCFCEAFVRNSKAFNKQLRTEGHITHSKPAPWERSIEKAWDVNGHALQSPDLQGAPQKPRLPPGSVSEPPQACVTQEYLRHTSLSSALWPFLPLQPPFPASMTMSPRASHFTGPACGLHRNKVLGSGGCVRAPFTQAWRLTGWTAREPHPRLRALRSPGTRVAPGRR